MVKSVHTLSNGSAGARSIALIISGQGTPFSRYRATGFMKRLGLVSTQLPTHRCKKASQPRSGGIASNKVCADGEIVGYITGYYSQTRPHQHNGGLPPNKAEEIYWNSSKSAAKIT